MVGLLFIKPIRKITYGNGITPILSLKLVFHSNSLRLQFPRNNNAFCRMQQVVEIVSIKCVRITTLTFQGHVTSRSRDHFFPRYVVSHRCSIHTNPLSWAACEILNLKHIFMLTISTTLTFRVTWRQWSRDRLITHGPFPIGVPWVLTHYLQRNPLEIE